MFGRKKKQQKTRKKKLFTWVFIVAILVGLSIYFIHFINLPATGVIKNTININQSLQGGSLKELTTDYFSLEYPDRYNLQVGRDSYASQQSWILIAQQSRTLKLGQASKISLSLVEIPTGGVKEDSAYKHFTSFPELYSISDLIYGGDLVIIAERTDPSFEHIILWPHGRYLLTFGLTSAGKDEDLITELDAMLRSLVWIN